MPIHPQEVMNKIGVMRGNFETAKGKMMGKKNQMLQMMKSKRSQMEAMKDSIVKPVAPVKPELNIPRPQRPIRPIPPEIKSAPLNRPFKLPQVASIGKRIVRPY